MREQQPTAGSAPAGGLAGSATPPRIAVAGATGLIGTELCAVCRAAGWEVLRLVRREARGPDDVRWDSQSGSVAAERLEGLDAAVSLAGASIGRRWTAEYKRELHASRVPVARNLATALAGLTRPPRVFVCASAVGYYGDRGDEPLTEDNSAGRGFLAELCRDWEQAAAPAAAAGIRCVHPRFGVVLAAHGGALPAMLPAFRLGLGGPIGGGRQYFSWILLRDAVGAVMHAVQDARLTGPVNAVAPEQVTQAQFARELGRHLRRPAVMPLPALAVRLLFGEMGRETLLASQRAVPARLTASGFGWSTPLLAAALSAALGESCAIN